MNMFMGKPPHRAVTIKDIGDRLGMSHSTVSRSLNDHPAISAETKARVRAAAIELGYVPNIAARAIRGDASLTFGLAIPELRNELYSRIAKEFAERCRDIGGRMLLVLTDDDPGREYQEIRALAESRVSGIAATLTGEPAPATLELLAHIPVVQIVRRLDALEQPALCLEERQGCADAVDHLVSLGHRRIAYIGTDRRVSSGRDRIEGYLSGHVRHGIAPLEGGMELGLPQADFGYAGVKRLLALPERPTALVIATSQLLVGALSALRDAEVAVPRDMSVIGYGNADWYALIDPPLTAVALPVDDLARAAVRRLHAAATDMGEIDEPVPIIAPYLNIRASTAPPGAS